MSGSKGKSGGARPGSGRPPRPSGKVKVQFNLTPEAIALLHLIPDGLRSKWLENAISKMAKERLI